VSVPTQGTGEEQSLGSTSNGRSHVDKAKPFCIPKREVWEAYKRVKANQGAAGVDGKSIAKFEEDLKNNLFKIWNRMSSGSYFPLLSVGLTYRRTMKGPGHWGYPRSQTVLPKQ
jgi:hypothetical protein